MLNGGDDGAVWQRHQRQPYLTVPVGVSGLWSLMSLIRGFLADGHCSVIKQLAGLMNDLLSASQFAVRESPDKRNRRPTKETFVECAAACMAVRGGYRMKCKKSTALRVGQIF